MRFTRRAPREACGVPPRSVVIASLMLIACGDSHETVEGPPPERLLIMQQGPCSSSPEPFDSAPMTCTFVYFNDEALIDACLVPDADSFDDYVEYRMDENGQVALDPRTQLPIAENERGTIPYPGSENCKADGIVTGPKGDTYYPSKFCRVPCKRSGAAGSGVP